MFSEPKQIPPIIAVIMVVIALFIDVVQIALSFFLPGIGDFISLLLSFIGYGLFWLWFRLGYGIKVSDSKNFTKWLGTGLFEAIGIVIPVDLPGLTLTVILTIGTEKIPFIGKIAGIFTLNPQKAIEGGIAKPTNVISIASGDIQAGRTAAASAGATNKGQVLPGGQRAVAKTSERGLSKASTSKARQEDDAPIHSLKDRRYAVPASQRQDTASGRIAAVGDEVRPKAIRTDREAKRGKGGRREGELPDQTYESSWREGAWYGQKGDGGGSGDRYDRAA